jgi:hypothetical protein
MNRKTNIQELFSITFLFLTSVLELNIFHMLEEILYLSASTFLCPEEFR